MIHKIDNYPPSITQYTRQINNENNYRTNKSRRIFRYNNSWHLSHSLYRIVYKFRFDEKSHRVCPASGMLTLGKKNSGGFVSSTCLSRTPVAREWPFPLLAYVRAVTFYVLLYTRMNISILITTNG